MPPPPRNVNPGRSFPHSVMLLLVRHSSKSDGGSLSKHLTLHQRPSTNQSVSTVPSASTRHRQPPKSLNSVPNEPDWFSISSAAQPIIIQSHKRLFSIQMNPVRFAETHVFALPLPPDVPPLPAPVAALGACPESDRTERRSVHRYLFFVVFLRRSLASNHSYPDHTTIGIRCPEESTVPCSRAR
jgi:hypothetical protein